MKHVAAVRMFALLAASVIFGGCPPSGPQNPPTVLSFTTSSDSLAFGGGDVTLAWSVADATTITLSGVGDVSRFTSRTVRVTQTTTFTLTASNQLGSNTASLTVTVAVPTTPPSISGFTASPASLPLGGGNVTLLWSQNLAQSLFIDNGVGEVTGLSQKTVHVTQTTTFTLTASNNIGSTQATTTVTVYVPTQVPTIQSFTASPNNLGIAGGSTTLSWNVIDGATFSISPGVGVVTGTSRSVNVTQTTTFTLTASNVVGSSTATTTVTVYVPTTPPTINSFFASPNSLGINGGSTTLSWNVTDASSLSIDNGVGVVSGLSSRQVNVTQTTTFTLTATNVRGVTTATTQVTVYVPSNPPTISSFTASPSSLPMGGGSLTLSWVTTDAQTLSIDQGVGDVTGRTSITVTTPETRAYKLTATNIRGSAQEIRLVMVNNPTTAPQILSFTASPQVFGSGGGTTTLSWNVAQAQTVTIDHGVGVVSGSGTRQVFVSSTTVFGMSATNMIGTSFASTTVTVNQPAPTIFSFSASPSTVPQGGGYVTLSWSTQNASSLSISPGVGTVFGSTSSQSVWVDTAKTFTLTATNSTSSTSATAFVGIQSSGRTVTGRVIYDGVNVGVSGAYVDVLGGSTTTTDSSGFFTLSNVPSTYDLAVSDVNNTKITVYRNLTRANVTLVHIGFKPTINSAFGAFGDLNESFGGSVSPGTLVMFGGPGSLPNLDNSGFTGSYAFGGDLQWYGNQNTGYFYAFEGLGFSSARVGKSAFASLSTFSSTSNNITLYSATTYNLWGTCTKPSSSYTIQNKRAGVKLSPNSAIHYETTSTSSSFDLYTAEVAGTEAFVSCKASDGQRTAFAREGGFGGDANVQLTMLTPPSLLSPSNNATNVGYGSTFSWTAYGTGGHVVHLTPVAEVASLPQIHLVTGAASITLPDLSQLALTLPTNTRYAFSVDGFDPLWDADAATDGTTLFDLLTEQGTFTRGTSASNNFFTP